MHCCWSCVFAILHVYKQTDLCYNVFILGIGEFVPSFGAKLCGKSAFAKGKSHCNKLFSLQKGEL